MLRIGCHLSTKNGFIGMAEDTVFVGGNTFQYFTRSPRGSASKDDIPLDVQTYEKFASEHNITSLVAYAPYDINPASSDASMRDFTVSVMKEDLSKIKQIPGQYYLIRPGSATSSTMKQGIANVASAISEVLLNSEGNKLLIANESGEGHQVCSAFEEIAKVISTVNNDSLGICLDCSAAWGAGYDIKNDFDRVLDEINDSIGLEKLKVIHLNDSLEDLGSHVNRHARIGEGKIGLDSLIEITKNDKIKDRVFIIEEPNATLEIYKHDISSILS